MKLNFSIDVDETFGNSFEDYIRDVYYEHDTGYKEVQTDKIPSLEEIVYKKAFDSLVADTKAQLKTKAEGYVVEFDKVIRQELEDSTKTFAQEVMQNFLDRKVITAKPKGYSSEIEEISITQYLENTLDDQMFVKRFDSDGKPDSYRAKYSGFDLTSKKMIEKMATTKFHEIMKKQKGTIESTLTKVVREKLAEQYISEDAIRKILEETKEGF